MGRRSGRLPFRRRQGTARLAVHVLPSGSKSYLVQYRVGAQLRRKALGLHLVVTAEQARGDANCSWGTWPSGARSVGPARTAPTRSWSSAKPPPSRPRAYTAA